MPVGLAARVKAHAKPRRSWPIRLGLVAAFGVILLLLGGVAVKSLMPTLFNNIQQMITGAAGQMGSGGK